MTKAQLNRDIKRLKNEIYRMSFEDLKQYQRYLLIEACNEFTRLYNADRKFEYMNKDSVLTMLKLNLSHRFMPLHNFGINIEL